jgi:hypothetical protein
MRILRQNQVPYSTPRKTPGHSPAHHYDLARNGKQRVAKMANKQIVHRSCKSFNDSYSVRETNKWLKPGISIIAQEFSWGRLQISEATFHKLLQLLGVFDEFVSVVRSHGSKIDEGERVWYGLRSCRLKGVDHDNTLKHGESIISIV